VQKGQSSNGSTEIFKQSLDLRTNVLVSSSTDMVLREDYFGIKRAKVSLHPLFSIWLARFNYSVGEVLVGSYAASIGLTNRLEIVA
jgi:hypothetical protein